MQSNGEKNGDVPHGNAVEGENVQNIVSNQDETNVVESQADTVERSSLRKRSRRSSTKKHELKRTLYNVQNHKIVDTFH